jgi:hypothetical protein
MCSMQCETKLILIVYDLLHSPQASKHGERTHDVSLDILDTKVKQKTTEPLQIYNM